MRKYQPSLSLLFVIALVLFLGVRESHSQTYIDVDPGFGTLNDAIDANTNPDAIFRLQRGDAAIYLLNGSISNTIAVHIQAVNDTGAIPKLIPGVGSGGSSDVAFRPKADLFLTNVYVTGMDAAGGMKSQIIRDKADSIKIFADSCFFENSAQSWIRTDNEMANIHITNSIIRNCLGDYANGRGIDDRGVNMDTLYLENNTFYCLSSRILRDGGGWINYVYVNHNTFVNIGKYMMAIGECPTVVFTNNLAINAGFMGHDQLSTGALLNLDPLTSPIFNGVQQSVEAHNNNFAQDPALAGLYPDTVVVLPAFNAHMIAVMDSSGFDTTNYSEYLEFTDALPAIDTIVTGYWAAGGNDAYPASGLQVTGDYDFSYSHSTQSYSGGSDGLPIGALTWFPNITGVKDNLNGTIPDNYSLQQNYPNPFNPTTMIEYSIPQQSVVKLIVYNILGQAVKTLVNTTERPGRHFITWNGTDEHGQNVSSGIYFYKLTTEKFSGTKKMLLLK